MQSAIHKYYQIRRFASYSVVLFGLLIHSFAHAAETADSVPEPPPDQKVTSSTKSDAPGFVVSDNLITDQSVSKSQTPKPITLPDDENTIRLLKISVDQYQLDDLIMVYQHEDMLLVPFGVFSELIDLAIKADPTTGIADGFVFDEEKTFLLDINRGEMTLSGVMTQFDNTRTAVRILDDIYIDSELLSEWLPLKIEIDLYASDLKIKPDEPLPFQLRKERESRMKRAQGRLVPKDMGYPRYTAPYEDWSYPHINFTGRAGVFKNNVDENSSTYSHATYATADLFKMESAWYLAGNKEEFFDVFRATFGRKDIDAELLGPAKAREYAFGHVVEPRIDLINRPISIEPGLYISNYPLTRQQQYDSHTFSGDLLPGWEVELYRNNSLLSYQSVSVEGRYQFEDVPLLYGHNHFRLVFYGPQGQIREETQTFELGQALTIPGEHNYRLFLSRDENFGNRAVMQYDVGINKRLSASASFARLPIDSSHLIDEPEKHHQYLTAGLKGFQELFYYKLNYTMDAGSGYAADWGIQSRLGPLILNLGEVYFNDFISEVFSETLTPIKQRRSVKIDTAIPVTFVSRMPISLEYEQDSYDDGSRKTRIINRISAQKHGYAVTNNLTFQSGEFLEDSLFGSLQVSRRAKKYNLRANFGYLLKPDSELDSISLTTDGFKLWGFNTSAGFSKVIATDSTQYTLGLNRQMDGYSLGMNTRTTSDGVFSFDLIFNTSLAREPRKGKWIRNARPVATQGAISANVFVDKNRDGRKDPEDDALPGVKININGGAIPNQTDGNGIAFNTGLVTYREMDVDIALNTLDDPLLLPAKSGVRVDLRPGHVTQLDFPIIMTGEIDGTTYVNFDGVEREASGVIIELVNQEDEVIQSVKTAYDGFYVLDKIPVGTFKLRISELQLRELDLQPVEPIIIEITADKQIINGQDFVLTKK